MPCDSTFTSRESSYPSWWYLPSLKSDIKNLTKNSRKVSATQQKNRNPLEFYSQRVSPFSNTRLVRLSLFSSPQILFCLFRPLHIALARFRVPIFREC